MIGIASDRQRRLLLMIIIPYLILTLVSQTRTLKEELHLIVNNKHALWRSSAASSSLAGKPTKEHPSFHLLVVGSEPSLGLCRTLFSATILGYPPPVLLDVNVTLDLDSDLTANTPDSAKINAINDYLLDEAHLDDQDFVLVTDGSDSWFQLPPHLMVKRYQSTVDILDYWYGLDHGSTYAHSVVYASTNQCLSMKYHGASNISCSNMPSQPPASVYEAALGDPFLATPPAYLHAGAVLGQVSGVRAFYARAASRLQRKDGAATTSANLLIELIGEQEYARKMQKALVQSSGVGILNWFWTKFGGGRLKHAGQSFDDGMLPEGNYEFGVGLDYTSSLFHISRQSRHNVKFLRYNDTVWRNRLEKPRYRVSPQLSMDISSSRSPVVSRTFASINGTFTSTQLPYNFTLDKLPLNIAWRELNLATDVSIPSIPALLHLSSEQRHNVEHLWTRMWFHPWARALLRNAVRSTEGPKAAKTAATDVSAHTRGGQGGIWTQDGQWMQWDAVCSGFEEGVFGDHMGPWGRESGEHLEYNSHGFLISGDE